MKSIALEAPAANSCTAFSACSAGHTACIISQAGVRSCALSDSLTVFYAGLLSALINMLNCCNLPSHPIYALQHLCVFKEGGMPL